MKNTFKFTAILSSIFVLILSGCRDKDIYKITYTGNVPVYMSYKDMRAAVTSESPKEEVEVAGKIYLYGQYLLINDYLKGIHVYDNSNPSNPVPVAFLNIPGNIDMAVSNNILYADSYVDLISIDISDFNNIHVLNRTEDVFTYKIPYPGNEYKVAEIDEDKGVVIGYELEEVSERTVYESHYYYYDCWDCKTFMAIDNGGLGMNRGNTNMNANTSGLAGSMAGFSLIGDYLYAINGADILTFSTSGLELKNTFTTERTLETIFPAKGMLFFGTTTGMVIYSLENPEAPAYFSSFNHAERCDPVVVQGDFAYVTLRSGNRCGGWTDQLDIINIADLTNPYLVKTQEMTNPHGLGIDESTLFICDGSDGLKVYDVQHHSGTSLTLTHQYPQITSMDVIPVKNSKILIMVASEGVYQYDYSDASNIQQISSILY